MFNFDKMDDRQLAILWLYLNASSVGVASRQINKVRADFVEGHANSARCMWGQLNQEAAERCLDMEALTKVVAISAAVKI